MAKCKICDSDNLSERYKVREMMFGLREKFSYFECRNCGCLQLEEIPENIANYYSSENYYSFTHKKNGIVYLLKRERAKYYLSGSGILGKFLKKKFPSTSFAAISRLNPKKDTSILDVGCGTGELLHLLSSIGFTKLMGIDPFLQADVELNTELKIKKQSIHEVSKSKKWDIVMFHHVFEHIFDPLETLRSAKSLLSNGGVIMIRIPTVSSFAWEHYKENWFQIDAPRHAFLHSRDSMTILAEQSGLKIANCYYDSDEKQFWASEQYKKDIPLLSEDSYAKNPKASIFSKEQILEYKKRSEKLNLENRGDQIVYILESK